MKKLIAAMAVATAGAAFAELGGGLSYETQVTAQLGLGGPHVYDYRASVKNMYLKLVPNVPYKEKKYDVYMKYQKNTSLKGWLIMDQGGVTSPTIMSAALDTYGWGGTGFDYGRNRGFLVVINPQAPKVTRSPKIMPAVLDAKWLDTSFQAKKEATYHKTNKGPAEGYLYVGGDAITAVRPQLDVLKPTPTELTANDVTQRDYGTAGVDEVYNYPNEPWFMGYEDEDGVTTNTVVFPGMVAIADYAWTSVHLFSAGTNTKEYFVNGPNWFTKNGAGQYSVFGAFEYYWDLALPEILRSGWYKVSDENYAKRTVINYYHDTWMNGSGFGTWVREGEAAVDYCCGWVATILPEDRVLDTLSGSLKGGLFLCTENGIWAKGSEYTWFDGYAWEDQFNTARIDQGGFKFAGDAWQNDLWQDGFFEVETTDIITGTWSIKLATSKFFSGKKAIAQLIDEGDDQKKMSKLIEQTTSPGLPATVTKKEPVLDDDGNPTYDDDGNPVMQDVTYENGKFAMNDTLWSAINGAALNLAKTYGGKVTLFDGTEIFSKKINDHYSGNLPMITPRFAIYYRLVYGTGYQAQQQP